LETQLSNLKQGNFPNSSSFHRNRIKEKRKRGNIRTFKEIEEGF
jgi:hypothetical protein